MATIAQFEQYALFFGPFNSLYEILAKGYKNIMLPSGKLSILFMRFNNIKLYKMIIDGKLTFNSLYEILRKL